MYVTNNKAISKQKQPKFSLLPVLSCCQMYCESPSLWSGRMIRGVGFNDVATKNCSQRLANVTKSMTVGFVVLW